MNESPTPARSFALALVALVGACIAPTVHAQTPGRVATSIEAAIAEPVFFHGRQIAIRAATTQDRSGTRIVVGNSDSSDKPKLHPVFVFWQQTPSRSDGEIRGEFFDLGRLREDDSRFSSYDFRPLLEAVSGGRWPNRDEVFVIVGATVNGRKAEARWSFNVAPKEAVQAGT